MKRAWLLVTLLLGGGCVSVPTGVVPVRGFDAQRYLGTWYEIARLDHSFERGLEQVTATYTQDGEDEIRVVNRGYDPARGRWREATGRARFVDARDEGRLKVSFFGPFYGAYTLMALDHEGYQHAMVCGPSTDYLWILARTPQLDAAVTQRLIEQARALGFPVDELLFPRQVGGP